MATFSMVVPFLAYYYLYITPPFDDYVQYLTGDLSLFILSVSCVSFLNRKWVIKQYIYAAIMTFILLLFQPIELLQDFYEALSNGDPSNGNKILFGLIVLAFGVSLVQVIRPRLRSMMRILITCFLGGAITASFFFHILTLQLSLEHQAEGLRKYELKDLAKKRFNCDLVQSKIADCWQIKVNNGLPENLKANPNVKSVFEHSQSVNKMTHGWLSKQNVLERPLMENWIFIKKGNNALLYRSTQPITVIRDAAEFNFNILVGIFVCIWWLGINLVSSFHRGVAYRRTTRTQSNK